MNLSENIFNAFEVVTRTHENVDKLMDYCKVKAEEQSHYILAAPKHLRWKSDNNYWGWNIRSFILLFQDIHDKELENEWRDGPIYVMEINLYNPDAYDEPMINLAKFEYEDISKWTPGCSTANHWIFYDPLYELDYETRDDGTYVVDVEEEYGNRYWGLKHVVGIEMPLVEITGDNASEKIFGGFDSLIYK